MEFLNNEITSKLEAKSFINDLFNDDKLFHFDEDPRDIINIEGNNLFTEKESLLLDDRLTEMFATGIDCYAYALKLIMNNYKK